MKTKPSTTLVYSTETGRICPDCSQPVAQCQCAANRRALAAASGAAADGVLRVSIKYQVSKKKMYYKILI